MPLSSLSRFVTFSVEFEGKPRSRWRLVSAPADKSGLARCRRGPGRLRASWKDPRPQAGPRDPPCRLGTHRLPARRPGGHARRAGRPCEIPGCARGEGSLEQRRAFLRGFVREIAIDPDDGSETITFYELAETSFMMVPGARVALLETFRSKRLDEFGLPREAWKVAA